MGRTFMTQIGLAAEFNKMVAKGSFGRLVI
jgi:hypothetical protein